MGTARRRTLNMDLGVIRKIEAYMPGPNSIDFSATFYVRSAVNGDNRIGRFRIKKIKKTSYFKYGSYWELCKLESIEPLWLNEDY